MSEQFDVIVVGAGPAGTSAAYHLAKAGKNVVLIERGEYPGAKNVMGGVLYRKQMNDIIPEFYKEAPIERPIVEQRAMLLDEKSAITMSYKSEDWSEEPFNNFTVLRAQFDQWFAKKAVEAGALLINETVVKECIVENGNVVGIRTDREQGDLYAKVVVLADGVNSLLAKSLGFHNELKPDQVALAAMQVLKLPKEKINDRFSLEGNQGVTIEMFGDATKGNLGTAFLYTNKETLSIGVGSTLSGLMRKKIKPYELLNYVKDHPMVRPYIEGAEPDEYLAHLIPEGGFNAMPKLVGNGVLICGDAAQLVNGIHREGSNMAMTSGKYAAETIIDAFSKDNFTESTLNAYSDKILESFIGQDLKKYKDATHTFEENPQYFADYIPLMNKAANAFFSIDGTPKKTKQKDILKMFTKDKKRLELIKDAYRVWKVMK